MCSMKEGSEEQRKIVVVSKEFLVFARDETWRKNAAGVFFNADFVWAINFG